VANDFKGLTAHSAEEFGSSRDHWWNPEFLRMVAEQWPLPEIKRVLDVGAGVGHWRRALTPVLGPGTRFTSVDREKLWAQTQAERARREDATEPVDVCVSDAMALPFSDGSFDLVTCQCLLMHVPAPDRAIAEMTRVLRPGGLLVVAEPTNITSSLVEAIALGQSPEAAAGVLLFHLRCVKGKARLNEGNDLVGESLPALLSRAGLSEVQLRLNDRAWPLLPPYGSPHQRAFRDDVLDATRRGRFIWDRATALRYFRAGGGADEEFEPAWSSCLSHQERLAEAIELGKLVLSGGGLFYLAWARSR
jgi:SAM-dependent methyltransferase